MRLDEVVGELRDYGDGLYGRAFGRIPTDGRSGKAIFHLVMSMHDHSVMTTAKAFSIHYTQFSILPGSDVRIE